MSADAWGGWQAFSDAARSYLEGAVKAATPGAAERFSDFLREQFAANVHPWSRPAPDPPQPSATGLFDAPAFGATREQQQCAQRMAEAVRRMDAAGRRLQRLWSDVLRDAASRFVTQLGSTRPASAKQSDLRQLYDQWIDCAEEAYARIAHGEAFCQAQAELLNASSAWRQEQRAFIEQCSKLLDLPTRSEINSLTRRLRALEVQLRERAEPMPAKPAPMKPAPMKPAPMKPARRPARTTSTKRSKRSKKS